MTKLPVSSEQVAGYESQVARQAGVFKRFATTTCDVDDLKQAGRIRVWQLLQRGIVVTNLAIKNAMRDELRRDARSSSGDGSYEIVPLPDELAV